MNTAKPKTIDECCGEPAGSFEKYLAAKKQFTLQMNKNRKARIKAVMETRPAAWVA